MLRKIKYLIRCILKMDYKALFKTVNEVHKLCKKNRIYLFFDIVKCGLKYGAGYKDYIICEFYKINDKQRATYVTRGVNNTITAKLNNKEFYHIFDYKNEFYEKFNKYIGRGWLDLQKASYEDFAEFMAEREVVMCKPSDLCCGQGVERLRKSDYTDLQQLYDKLKELNAGLVEDFVIQHPRMQELNDSSVNTIRVVTMYYNNKPNIGFVCIRIGNSDRPVDNFNAGGMCALVDIETGTIRTIACDKEGEIYEKHPRTGCDIVGFKIPCWEEAKKMCLEASCVVPEMGYIGWDVCITENGPIFIEANNLPGHDVYQMPAHLSEDRIGMLPRFKKIIPDL